MTRKGDFCDGCLFILGYATCDQCEEGSLFQSEDRKKRMNKKRFHWHYTGKDAMEKWLLDLNQHNRVVAIVTCMSPEGVVSPWWAVYTPFKKKAVSQHLNETDATDFAEETIAVGEKEERVEW